MRVPRAWEDTKGPRFGCEAAARVAKRAHEEGLGVREEGLALGARSGEELPVVPLPNPFTGLGFERLAIRGRST